MKKFILLLLVVFAMATLSIDLLRVRESLALTLNLPEPNQLLLVSKYHSMPVLRGLKIDPANPENIEFYVDSQDMNKVESEDVKRLIDYFFAGLTVADEKLWVNLSPYEEDRIIDDNLSVTDLGRDLLRQDYIIKQLSASLTHPETPTGAKYWNSVGATSYNKIWISPDVAEIFSQDNYVFVTEASLKVETEKDYLASALKTDENSANASQTRTKVLLPEITKDVNNGKNFSTLRQIYSSLILAKWFKQNFFQSFYTNYINQNKVTGIDSVEPELKNQVYKLYCEAFGKGAYNFVANKKFMAQGYKQKQKRSYFSGGIGVTAIEPVSSSINKLKDVPIVGKFFHVTGKVNYRYVNPMLINALFNMILALSLFIHQLDLESFFDNPFGIKTVNVQTSPSKALTGDWVTLQEFLLENHKLDYQQTFIKKLIAQMVEAETQLHLVKEYSDWQDMLKSKHLPNNTGAFVKDKSISIYVGFASPMRLWHEFIHVAHDDFDKTYQSIVENEHLDANEKFNQVHEIPMFKKFQEIQNMVYQTSDTLLIQTFRSIYDNLSYDYNNPLKKVWYNSRLERYSLDSAVTLVQELTKGVDRNHSLELLNGDEFYVNNKTHNYSAAVNEFFAHIYGVAVAHDLGLGQENLDEKTNASIAKNTEPYDNYRTLDYVGQSARFLFQLKNYPQIMKVISDYYQDQLKMPSSKAFIADFAVKDNYSLGVIDDDETIFQLASYYDFIGRNNQAVKFYNKSIELSLQDSTGDYKQLMQFVKPSLALAKLYLKAESTPKLDSYLTEIENVIYSVLDNSVESDKAYDLLSQLLLAVEIRTSADQKILAQQVLAKAMDIFKSYDDGSHKIVSVNLLAKFVTAYLKLGMDEQVSEFSKLLKNRIDNLDEVEGLRDIAESLSEAAEVIANTGDYASAHKIHEGSLEYYADTATVESNILNMYISREEFELATEHLESVVDSLSPAGLYIKLAALYHLVHKDNAKAIKTLEKYLEIDPDNQRVLQALEEFKELGQTSAVDGKSEEPNSGGIDLVDIELKNDGRTDSARVDIANKISIISLSYHVETIELGEIGDL